MKTYSYILVVGVSFLFGACFQEIDTEAIEKTVENNFTSEFSIYNNVTFYKVYENTTQEVVTRKLGFWDLAFQSAKEGDNVLVNYTISGRAIKTGTTDFSQVDKGTVEELFDSEDWKFNDPAYSNIKDSIALKDWENKEVYLVYRGNTFSPENAYFKLQFLSKTPETYTFQYAHVESAAPIQATINRTESLANVYYSFDTATTVEHEPTLNDWDFYFAPYYGWFETLTAGVYSPYNLTGVMINNENGVRVAQVFDELIAYEEIDLGFAQNADFTSWKGAIGSTWKKIPSTENPIYDMDTTKKYILKLADGNYYKLRFIDFYNDAGEKGFTSFEIQVLN
jgi:hypothetical protein